MKDRAAERRMRNFSGIDDEEGGVQPRHAAGVRGLSGGMAGRYD